MITSETTEYLPEALIGYCTSQPYTACHSVWDWFNLNREGLHMTYTMLNENKSSNSKVTGGENM